MSYFRWLFLLVISCLLLGCTNDIDEGSIVNERSDNAFDLDITSDEYASIKQFSGRSEERKNVAFKSFSDRYEIASYLINHDLEENNEIKLKLAEFFHREVINYYLNDLVAEKISDEMIFDYYKKNKDQFIYNEYIVSVVSFRNNPSFSKDEVKIEKKIKDVSEQIVKGMNLEEIKDVHISDQVIRESNSNQETIEQLKAIDVGGVTNPIKTRSGIKLYRLDSINELANSFEELKSKIRYKMEQDVRSAEFERLLKLSVR